MRVRLTNILKSRKDSCMSPSRRVQTCHWAKAVNSEITWNWRGFNWIDLFVFFQLDDQSQRERSWIMRYQFTEPTQGISPHFKGGGKGRAPEPPPASSRPMLMKSRVSSSALLCWPSGPLPETGKGGTFQKTAIIPSLVSICSALTFGMYDFYCLEINQCWSPAPKLIKSNKMFLN